MLGGASVAGNAYLRQAAGGGWEVHGGPTEAAFLVAERKPGVPERRQQRVERVAEISFTSERKMMSSVERDHERGDALVIVTEGAPNVLLQRCTRAHFVAVRARGATGAVGGARLQFHGAVRC